jgi:hypothetical protein
VKSVVEARYEFDGEHAWPNAPQAVGFLRYPHRHRFVVRARKAVTHLDRETEFFLLRRAVADRVAEYFAATSGVGVRQMGSTSCEMLAARLLEDLDLDECSVHEDDENGSIVTR